MSAKPVFLVVDDSRLHHQMYMLVFAKGALAGSTLLHAKNGREGYALFTTHPEIEMVFLDLNMPEMNGLEFLEEYVAECTPLAQAVGDTLVTLERRWEEGDPADQLFGTLKGTLHTLKGNSAM